MALSDDVSERGGIVFIRAQAPQWTRARRVWSIAAIAAALVTGLLLVVAPHAAIFASVATALAFVRARELANRELVTTIDIGSGCAEGLAEAPDSRWSYARAQRVVRSLARIDAVALDTRVVAIVTGGDLVEHTRYAVSLVGPAGDCALACRDHGEPILRLALHLCDRLRLPLRDGDDAVPLDARRSRAAGAGRLSIALPDGLRIELDDAHLRLGSDAPVARADLRLVRLERAETRTPYYGRDDDDDVVDDDDDDDPTAPWVLQAVTDDRIARVAITGERAARETLAQVRAALA